jgi:hypothetical protein
MGLGLGLTGMGLPSGQERELVEMTRAADVTCVVVPLSVFD